MPLFDRVLVQRVAQETQSKGGVLIPETAQTRVHTGTVVAVGPGARNDQGSVIPNAAVVGDKVMLPEFGGTKVTLENEVSTSDFIYSNLYICLLFIIINLFSKFYSIYFKFYY